MRQVRSPRLGFSTVSGGVRVLPSKLHRNSLDGTDWSVQCLEPTWTNIWGTHDRKIVLFGSLDIEAVWEFLESVDSARFV